MAKQSQDKQGRKQQGKSHPPPAGASGTESPSRPGQTDIDSSQPMQQGASQQGSRQTGGSDLEQDSSDLPSGGESGQQRPQSGSQGDKGSTSPGRQSRDSSERPEALDDDEEETNRDALSRPAGGSPNTPRG